MILILLTKVLSEMKKNREKLKTFSFLLVMMVFKACFFINQHLVHWM